MGIIILSSMLGLETIGNTIYQSAPQCVQPRRFIAVCAVL